MSKKHFSKMIDTLRGKHIDKYTEEFLAATALQLSEEELYQLALTMAEIFDFDQQQIVNLQKSHKKMKQQVQWIKHGGSVPFVVLQIKSLAIAGLANPGLTLFCAAAICSIHFASNHLTQRVNYKKRTPRLIAQQVYKKQNSLPMLAKFQAYHLALELEQDGYVQELVVGAMINGMVKGAGMKNLEGGLRKLSGHFIGSPASPAFENIIQATVATEYEDTLQSAFQHYEPIEIWVSFLKYLDHIKVSPNLDPAGNVICDKAKPPNRGRDAGPSAMR